MTEGLAVSPVSNVSDAVTLQVKPLRERPEDIVWLAKRFATAIAERLGE